MQQLNHLLANPYALAGVILVGALLSSRVVAFIITTTVGAAVRRTKTEVDDRILAALHRPIVLTVIFAGLAAAVIVMPMIAIAQKVTLRILTTITVFVWAVAASEVGAALLTGLSRRAGENALVQTKTVPAFEMLVKLTAAGLALYALFVTWSIDLTAWLASAGIVGIAIGFAAQDTLANFFSGIFILADAPYKIGDVIVLDDGVRGQVTSIGIRSTRLLTRDNIEITIPNAVIGSSKIINEAGGPAVHTRVKTTVDAAYGSDIDQVRKVLEKVCQGVKYVRPSPTPVIRFTEFGASGLTHDIYVWIDEPFRRENVRHLLNTKIYKSFAEAGIEIPYSKHDVYIKEMPNANRNPPRGARLSEVP